MFKINPNGSEEELIRNDKESMAKKEQLKQQFKDQIMKHHYCVQIKEEKIKD